MFDEQKALDSIDFLAADALQGRLVGTPGNLEAATSSLGASRSMACDPPVRRAATFNRSPRR